MIASMLKLSRNDCDALNLKDPYGLHRVVYSLFPKKNGKAPRDFLFADKGGDFSQRKVLILSQRKPLDPKYGEISSKQIPESFLSHSCYGFEITLNPVKRNGPSGITTPITGTENLRNWFLNKSVDFGFSVEPTSLQVCRMGVINFEKEKDGKVFKHTHNTAAFIGKLTVTNRNLFLKSFKEGIGRARGFGFGLLQVVPIRK